LKTFYKPFSIFVGIGCWFFVSLQIFKPEWLQTYSWFLYIYFVAITLLSFYLIDNSIKTKEPMDFYNASMGSTTIRLFVSGGILFYYYFNYTENLVHFTVTFFVLYFSFTAFEVIMLLKKMKT
jgi:hypothetical protein